MSKKRRDSHKEVSNNALIFLFLQTRRNCVLWAQKQYTDCRQCPQWHFRHFSIHFSHTIWSFYFLKRHYSTDALCCCHADRNSTDILVCSRWKTFCTCHRNFSFLSKTKKNLPLPLFFLSSLWFISIDCFAWNALRTTFE